MKDTVHLQGMRPVSTDFRTRFGDMLRQLRRAANIRQLDLAVALNIHDSEVSRWEKCIKLPSLGNMEAIRKNLPMRPLDFEALYYAWFRETQKTPHALRLDTDRPDFLIDFLAGSIDMARDSRQTGNPRTAMRLSERDVIFCLGQLRKFTWGSAHDVVLALASELVLEYCKAGLDFLPGLTVKAGALNTAVRLQKVIAQESRTPTTLFLAKLSEEGATYVSGNVPLAFVQSRALLAWEWPVPLMWKIEVIRALAINAGKVGDRTALIEVDRLIADLRTRYDGEIGNADHIFLLEGVARGWGTVDPDKGIDILRSMEGLRQQSGGGRSDLRSVQLIRTEAEIAVGSHRGEGRVALVEKIEAGVRLSQQNGYDRYVAQLRLLRQKLD